LNNKWKKKMVERPEQELVVVVNPSAAPPEESCENCRYLRVAPKYDDVLICCRYPPVVVYGVGDRPAAEAKPEEIFYTRFPIVEAHYWCGEHGALVGTPMEPTEKPAPVDEAEAKQAT
jgi:hypothetical protein